MHQYLTSTCIATNQKPEITLRIQIATPALAMEYPFLMRGILSMAAVHLSRIRPSRQGEYLLIARRYQSLALPAYRLAIQDINERNCHALIAFSKGILWSAFASPAFATPQPMPEQELPVHADAGGQVHWLPKWFYLLRGSCLLVNIAQRWIKDGPHFLINYCNEPVDYAASVDDEHILTLISHLRLIAAFTPEDELWELEIETDVARKLRKAFARATMTNQNTPLRNAINIWIGSLPQAYMELLQQRKPRSLAILAFFCVLVHRSENVWFMQGNTVRLLSSIEQNLDDPYRDWIRWPCSLIFPAAL